MNENKPRKKIYSTEGSIGYQLLKIKKKKYQYTPDEVMKVFELLDENKKAQEVADQTIFSARQVKKLRYIKRHMRLVEFNVLMSAKYYISSLEKYIKKRIKEEKS